MNNVSRILYAFSNWPTVLLATLSYGIFLLFVIGPHAAETQLYAGAWGGPDGNLYYSPDTLYAQLSNWGAAGKQHYIDFRRGLDPIWALTYTAFLITVTSLALRAATPPGDWRRLLNLSPLVPMFADLLENALGISLVTAHPERIEWLAWTASIVTSTKWFTLALAHLIMLYAVAIAAITKLWPNRLQRPV